MGVSIRVPTSVRAALMLVAGLAASPTQAVDFFVDSTLDQLDDDVLDGLCHTAAGTCTLRAAVMQANRISGAGANIFLPAGTYTLTRPAAGGDGDDSGDLNFTAPAAGNPIIELIGAGAQSTIIDANQLERVIRIDAGREANLTALTLRNGFAVSGLGGGLYSAGATRLTRVVIRDSQASILGGGIFVPGAVGSALRILESVIRNNQAGNSGGGLSAVGATTVERSIVSGNSALYGGGIDAQPGADVRIVSSTVSANRAALDAGGIQVGFNGSVNVYSSTVAFNQADSDQNGFGEGGGAQVSPSGTLNLRNSLLAGNYVFDSQNPDDCAGSVASYGRNLFGDTTGCTVVLGSGSWDLLNDLATLGPLAKNGGPTETHALLPGSNAIDGGDPVNGCIGPTAPLTEDQRGAPRYSGLWCDVGAYEEGALFFDGFESGDRSAWSL
ncbi:MAG: choice-of-anchor Q domain-containing protein [Thermoanaerobaculia bacterium]